MKKINSVHNDADRIVCCSARSTQKFFFQPAGTSERYWLFETGFSGSVFALFRDCGRRASAGGYSMTLRELYRVKRHDNPRISKILERIPGQIDYVLREIAMDACGIAA